MTATPYSYNIIAPANLTPIGGKFDEAGVRREAYNFYFQDAWKATPHLTVNYGLRYEVNSRIHEATKRTSLPDSYRCTTGNRPVLGSTVPSRLMLINPAASLRSGLERLGAASRTGLCA